jgi:protease-4
MAFLRGFWRALVFFKDLMVLTLLLLFFIGLWAAIHARGAATNQVPGEGALVVDLSGTLVEQSKDSDLFTLASNRQLPSETQARDVIRAVRAAADDGRIKAIVLNLDNFVGGGQANVTAIGRELDRFKAKGKPVYAYATGYLDDGYLLAAHANEVWLNPLGAVLVTGPGGVSPYFGAALEKLGVKVNVFRVGTYKSFVEPFTRTEQSPEAKQADQALVDTLWRVYVEEARRARPKADIPAYLQTLPARIEGAGGDLAQASVAGGLVDRLGDYNELGARLRQTLPAAKDKAAPGGFAQVELRDYLGTLRGSDAGSGPAVGVVYVAGNIVDGDADRGSAGGDTISELVRKTVAENPVKALVVRVDSPGGSALASEKIRQALLAAKARGIPVVTSMGPVAASGGYWVSTAGDTIFADPATITGSIGVFAILPSFEGSLKKLNIGADGVRATPYAGEPDILRGIGPETQLVLQAGVNDIYRRFLKIVADNRHSSPDKIDPIAQGRVWAGSTASQLHLVDRMGGLDAAVAEARRLAKLPDDARVIEIEPRPFAPKELVAELLGRPKSDAATDVVAKAAARSRLRLESAAATALSVSARPGVMALCAMCVDAGWSAPPTPAPGWLELALARLK